MEENSLIAFVKERTLFEKRTFLRNIDMRGKKIFHFDLKKSNDGFFAFEVIDMFVLNSLESNHFENISYDFLDKSCLTKDVVKKIETGEIATAISDGEKVFFLKESSIMILLKNYKINGRFFETPSLLRDVVLYSSIFESSVWMLYRIADGIQEVQAFFTEERLFVSPIGIVSSLCNNFDFEISDYYITDESTIVEIEGREHGGFVPAIIIKSSDIEDISLKMEYGIKSLMTDTFCPCGTFETEEEICAFLKKFHKRAYEINENSQQYEAKKYLKILKRLLGKKRWKELDNKIDAKYTEKELLQFLFDISEMYEISPLIDREILCIIGKFFTQGF